MPAISKIRLTNVVYEEGRKRYNDELFRFDGHNGAILLENGGGKTVFIHTVLQAILPHVDLADRKIKHTLQLENAPAHIAIEWLLNDEPRRYVVTAVSLFMTNNGLDSLRYVYEYNANDPHGIEGIPFVREGRSGKRPAERGEMQDYYHDMKVKSMFARTFSTIKEYKSFLEEQYHIISSEWESIVKINSTEGGVETFFDECKTTNQLFDRLLIPIVESAIVGHDEKLFADLFEKQLASFKHYKKLKETIEENKRIHQQLEQYVGVYEQLHQQQLLYEQEKQHAKGVWLETLKQKQACENEQNDNVMQWEEWSNAELTHRKKRATYHILLEQMRLNEFKREYEQALVQEKEKEEEMVRLEHEYYSLQLVKYKSAREQHVEMLAYIEQQMAKLKEDETLAHYEEQLEVARRSLLGLFMEQLEKIEKDERNVRYELHPIQKQMEQWKKDIETRKKEEQETREKRAGIQKVIHAREKDMEHLKQRLLANPTQQSVEEEMEKWMEREQWLDEELVRLRQEIKQLKQLERDIEAHKEALEKQRANKQAECKALEKHIQMIESEEQALIKKLASVRPQWVALDSVYIQEETIQMRLYEEIEKRIKEREKLLVQERIASRFVDAYGGQDLFFADPFLAEQVSSWKSQFHFLATGVEYLQSLEEEEREKKQEFPLWPMTLITTAKAKEQLIQKVRQCNDRMQWPIVVLSVDEASRVENEHVSYGWVPPYYWQEVIDPTSFAIWKKRMCDNAEHIMQRRQEKEAELRIWQDVQQAWHTFLATYPYEIIESLRMEHADLLRSIEQLAITIEKEKKRINECRLHVERDESLVSQYEGELSGFRDKIKDATTYIQYKKEVREGQKQIHILDQQLTSLTKEIVRFTRSLEDALAQSIELQERLRSLDTERRSIEQHYDYRSLRHLIPIYSGQSEDVIREHIREFELRIRGIKTSYGEWKEKKQSAQKEIDRLTHEINKLKKKQIDLDETMIFPSDGEYLLGRLEEQMTSGHESLKHLKRQVQEALKRKEQQKGVVKAKEEQFQEQFPNEEKWIFSNELSDVAVQLDVEREMLMKRKTFLEQERERLTKEIRDIEQAERSLHVAKEVHHFHSPAIVALSLNEEEVASFTYDRCRFVEHVIGRLKVSKQAVELAKERVEREKRLFKEFCRTSIQDVKMQQTAINGIEHKETYEDIIAFKKHMMQSVERATHYANEHIRQKDAELQAFINHIHTHLRTLVEELKQIPNKTRVKVGEEWKRIFTFAIPDWEEEVGKMRIRNYIEWMLQQLESERFLNEHGKQDEAKVRKEIEMWLQSKQLLQVVMNNEGMKVSCRKVTNDNKVTTRSYLWEQSNVWSGGEKWSKNMTLFLGILNYVAEKKQHIRSKMRRHRTVILDNPFGKASSDHVLMPVFFVAEQLGFQIIALTAHAEGKFLRDYFPIIYSCRLRSSSDPNKQIMTQEKWIHHAYFQDHDPKSLERLGETEQLELF
ncbi:myosin heavy subunit [Anoxybacillus tengchongensis]|uniref:Myosin heavy subunit n=1 Tax=Anoxybacillus tengchongensis TaxID=576944 RepID=A0A7X0D8F9_9BACL|nr:hypothetical protein [Anoxybacillus tengchongensis]MBB6175697.1 myosin heavy subunit [Anoxybacillus tengchongensis]